VSDITALDKRNVTIIVGWNDGTTTRYIRVAHEVPDLISVLDSIHTGKWANVTIEASPIVW
jgi:hypothetical protein